METSRYRSSKKQLHRILSIKITYHTAGTACSSLPAIFHTQKRHLRIPGHESVFPLGSNLAVLFSLLVDNGSVTT